MKCEQLKNWYGIKKRIRVLRPLPSARTKTGAQHSFVFHFSKARVSVSHLSAREPGCCPTILRLSLSTNSTSEQAPASSNQLLSPLIDTFYPKSNLPSQNGTNPKPRSSYGATVGSGVPRSSKEKKDEFKGRRRRGHGWW